MLAALGEGSFAAAGGRPADLSQTDTDLKAAVPLLPDDEANFVTGLALDFSDTVCACLRARASACARVCRSV